MAYSFDDLHIGRLRESGSSLETREIARPSGLLHDDWYALAAKVCELLNAQAAAGPRGKEAW